MATPPSNIPWGLHPLKPWIITELENRSKETNMNIPTNGGLYSGPKTAWARFFSNGIKPNPDRTYPDVGNGFMMFGSHGFNDTYGFNDDGFSTIGMDCDGNPRKLEAAGHGGNSFPHRPPPSIESIEVKLYGGQNSSFSGLCRRARVNWKCYSLDQLNALSPYFLSPKVTNIIEWGWNNYNEASLINLKNNNLDGLMKIMLDGNEIMNRIELSNGNYDAMMGFVVEYGFDINAIGGYDCFTEFVNANWLIEGQEYKNSYISHVTKDKDGKENSVLKKDFISFSKDDLNNLTIEDKSSGGKNVIKFDTKGKTYSPTKKNSHHDGLVVNKNWLRMDLVQDIINRYFSLVFENNSEKKIGTGLKLDISDVVVCAHPSLKSTSIDILVPNQYAPRLVSHTYTDLHKGSSTLRSVGEYVKLFEKSGIATKMESLQLSNTYDDLKSLINPNGKSFPVYEKGKNENNKFSESGTWGYLSDLFISTELLTSIVTTNDSVLKVIQTLCDHISAALCGVVQLKVVPHPLSSNWSIQDMNYNPRSSVQSITELTRFTPGSVNSAYMTNVTLGVKLSQEMINQMVASSAAGKSVDGNIQKIGPAKVSRFMGNDRLYSVGVVGDNLPEDKKSDDIPNPRDFTKENFFTYCTEDSSGKLYIIIEKDESLMKSLVSIDKSGVSIHINSPIMSGTKFGMETLGIGGFTFLGQFTLDHVPETYAYKNCVWQIADIVQTVAEGVWKTHITADCRPLSYIK